MFSPAAKAGLVPGNSIVLINDWKVEAMEQVSSVLVIDNCPHHRPHRTLENQSQVEAALSILLAAGFSVQLAWINSSQPLDGSWQPLQNL